MSLTPQFLDELRSRTLLSALVARTLKITKAGREFKGCCPFHNEKTPSFYVNDDKGFYHCFGCSAHGDAIRWMTDQRGLGFMDAVKELAEAAGMEVPAPDPRAAEKAERGNALYDVMAAAQDWFVQQLQGIEGADARAYLKKRGLSESTIKVFGLGFAPDARGKLKAALNSYGNDKLIESGLLISVEDKDPYDRFRGRLMIPIRDPRGRVIAFGGRILGAGEPKYLNSPDTPLFDKGRTLYNLDRAGTVARKSQCLVVVEGYLDVIMMTQAGIEDVVAPLGTALTEPQIEQLWRYTSTPILCFDGDSAGQKASIRAAKRALPMLKPGFSIDFVKLVEGQDPADMVERGAVAELKHMLATKRADLSKQVWEAEVHAEPLSSPSARAGLKDRLDQLARGIENELVRQEYRSTFNSIFWDQFGWRRKDVSGVSDAFAGLRAKPLRNLSDLVIRAVLMGLSRYPEILRSELEQISLLKIENSLLREWRDILVDASLENPDLDESLIDTILKATFVEPIKPRDLKHDLGFSFYYARSGEERPGKDLREVIATLHVEREIEIQLAAASERFKAATEDVEWVEQQRLYHQREAVREKLRSFGELEDFLPHEEKLKTKMLNGLSSKGLSINEKLGSFGESKDIMPYEAKLKTG
jgi:DNA primase